MSKRGSGYAQLMILNLMSDGKPRDASEISAELGLDSRVVSQRIHYMRKSYGYKEGALLDLAPGVKPDGYRRKYVISRAGRESIFTRGMREAAYRIIGRRPR